MIPPVRWQWFTVLTHPHFAKHFMRNIGPGRYGTLFQHPTRRQRLSVGIFNVQGSSMRTELCIETQCYWWRVSVLFLSWAWGFKEVQSICVCIEQIILLIDKCSRGIAAFLPLWVGSSWLFLFTIIMAFLPDWFVYTNTPWSLSIPSLRASKFCIHSSY